MSFFGRAEWSRLAIEPSRHAQHRADRAHDAASRGLEPCPWLRPLSVARTCSVVISLTGLSAMSRQCRSRFARLGEVTIRAPLRRLGGEILFGHCGEGRDAAGAMLFGPDNLWVLSGAPPTRVSYPAPVAKRVPLSAA